MKSWISWALLCVLLMGVLGGCSSGTGPSGGLDLDKAQPLLNAAAEATAASAGGAGFDGQCSASFFTDLVYAALRDGALTVQNSPFTLGGMNAYTIADADQAQLYAQLFSAGAHPGWSGGSISVRANAVTVAVSNRHPLMPQMRFDVTGVAPCADYENAFTLTAVLRGDNAITGQVEYGRYTLDVVQNAQSPFGCTLAAIRTVSSILAPAPAATQAAQTQAPATAAPEQSQSAQTGAQDDPLTAFFGYASVDALEDWSPVLRAAADSCLKLEYNLTAQPEPEMFWYIVSGAVSVMGSQLPGVSMNDQRYTMVSDDMTITMENFFKNAPETIAPIPESCAGLVSLSGSEYTFSSRSVDAFHITQYQVSGDCVIFTMSDAQNHRVNVTLAKNSASGYGVSIDTAEILP